MNERERKFFQEMSELGLTKNQSKIVFGLLSGKHIKQCGLPETSLDRTMAELHHLGIIEKTDGVWRISAQKLGPLALALPAPVAGAKMQEGQAVPPLETPSPAAAAEAALSPPPASMAASTASPPPSPPEKDPQPDPRLAHLPADVARFLARPPLQLPKVWETLKALGVARELRIAAATIKLDYDNGEEVHPDPVAIKALTRAEAVAARIYGR